MQGVTRAAKFSLGRFFLASLFLAGSAGLFFRGPLASEALLRRDKREGNSFSVRVDSGTRPVHSAEVFIGIHLAGRTDGLGIYQHHYTTRPEQVLHLAVRKTGFREWKKEVRISPGAVVRVQLVPDSAHRLFLKAINERFGVLSGIGGLEVYADGELRGTTDPYGNFVYSRELPGPVEIEVRHPRNLTPPWKKTISLQGDQRLRRFFYPMEPDRIRIGVLPFQANTYRDDSYPHVLEVIREALKAELSRQPGFDLLADERLEEILEWYGIDSERVAAKGWEDTDLRWDLDIILRGSVGRDIDYVVEIEARGPGGEEILRVLERAGEGSGFQDCGQRLGRAIKNRYPFRGWILDVEGQDLKIQLGVDSGWSLNPGDLLVLHSFVNDPSGRRLAEIEIGTARIEKIGEKFSWAKVEKIAGARQVRPGDLAVRYASPPPGAAGTITWSLIARSGKGDSGRPLEGVNVYLDGHWVGRTDREGRAEIFLGEGETHRLDLYRQGYGPATGTIRSSAARKETLFYLPRQISRLRIESDPPGVQVWLDEHLLGRTPLQNAGVPIGDHELRMEAGGDYRGYRRVVSFNRPRVEFAGENTIVMEIDYLRLGFELEEAGEYEAAMDMYLQVPAAHTDLWEARRQLAFLTLSSGRDPGEAILRFQELLNAGEIFHERMESLVKVFAGIGQAYLDLGLRLEDPQPLLAQTKFLQALFYLQRVKGVTGILTGAESERILLGARFNMALIYQKLYGLTSDPVFLRNADNAWREYFDLSPARLLNNPEFRESRETGRRRWSEIRRELP
ncbi:MAG: PEGA domain-containing protein [Acidobacteria bacterium]|nr:PEGA domain-containing protein [Acidobacteriota bacterium]